MSDDGWSAWRDHVLKIVGDMQKDQKELRDALHAVQVAAASTNTRVNIFSAIGGGVIGAIVTGAFAFIFRSIGGHP